jgi:hypothetical protein
VARRESHVSALLPVKDFVTYRPPSISEQCRRTDIRRLRGEERESRRLPDAGCDQQC